MICPQCHSEYRPGFTRCSDCDLELVERQSAALEAPQPAPEPGDPNEDPFCSFWKGDDPRVHAELCQVLDDAGIAHHTVFRREHLFNLKNYPSYEVGVPFSLFQRAESVVVEAFGSDTQEAPVELQQAPFLPYETGGRSWKLPESLTPGDGVNIYGPPSAGAADALDPEGITAKVWDANGDVATDFLVAALHENGIQCRVEQEHDRETLYVLPQDETLAREIIREIVERKPPE